MRHHKLCEKINQLRANAASIYEICLSQGIKPEDTIETIRPLSSMLDQLISASIKEDVAGVAFTIKRLNQEINYHKDSIRFLTEKILDTNSYIEKIKTELIKEMESRNTLEIHSEGFTLCLVEKSGGQDIVVK